MKQEITHTSNQSPSVHPEIRGEAREPVQSPNPLLQVHRLLRGRYRYAMVAIAILGSLGAIVGYKAVTLKYRSTGAIRVVPAVPRIIYTNEENQMLPMFNAFVDTQVMLIKSHRIAALARQSNEWKARGRESSVDGTLEFMTALSVYRDRKSQIISVRFEDASATASQIAVKASINAYMDVYGEADARERNDRLKVLESRRLSLTNQANSIHQQILGIANEFGSDALVRQYELKYAQMEELERLHRNAELNLAAAESVSSWATSSEREENLNLEDAARMDQQIANHLRTREQLERKLYRLEGRFGRNHWQVQDFRSSLESLDRLIKQRAQDLANSPETYETSQSRPKGFITSLSVDQLRAKEKNLQELFNEIKAEAVNLGQKNLHIATLQTNLVQVKEWLRQTELRLEQLNVETAASSRISVISEGDPPLEPYNKHKQIQAMVASSMGGAALGLGLVLAFGILDRRYRNFHDARDNLGDEAFLGLLPKLPEDLADPQQALGAALSVHEIRARLQISSRANGVQTLAVTSASPGAGKTSLTLALGLSYAAAGTRTLLIDLDIAGSSLSRKVKKIARKRLGMLLLDNGITDQTQVAQALELARRNGRRLGDTMVDLGFLTQGQLADVLNQQSDQSLGILDVLNRELFDDCIADTGIANLSIMPTGQATIDDLATISQHSLSAVLQNAREKYQAIIVDTGPILASLEASVICGEMDQVVLILSHGEHKRRVHQALNRLATLEANVQGIVFNRAAPQDLEQFGSQSSLGSRLSGQSGISLSLEARDHSSLGIEYGPIANATAAWLPVSRHAKVRNGQTKE